MMGCGGNCLDQDGQDEKMDRMGVWQVWRDELLAQPGEVLKG